MTLRGKLLFLRIGLLGCFGLSATSRAQSVTLSLASGSGTPGGSVILPLTITSAGGAQAAGIQWSLSYPSDITGVTVNFGNSATTAQKSLYCNGTQCLMAGFNTTIIPDGTVATATFQIASNPSATTIPIQITAVVATTAAGSAIPTAVGSGSVSLSLLPTLSGISCATTTINTPGNTLCTVSLTSAALLGGALVALSSNNASLTVPASVTFAAGQTSVSFTATSVGVTVDQVAVITAVYGSARRTVSFSLMAPVQLTGLVCSPAVLSSGGSTTCTVLLNKATSSIATVALSSDNTAVSVPGSLTVPLGQSSAIFQATAGNVSGSQNATITAAFNGVSHSATLSVNTRPVPTADSVSPSASAGATQIFTFVFSDSQSAANLSAAAILFAPSLSYPDSCFVIYDRTRGTIQLEWDNVSGADAKPVSSSNALQNSQCLIGATTVTSSALSNTITLAITFKDTFSGLKNIYMYGADTSGTINTGWVQRGTYTVTTMSAGVPSADSVSPEDSTGTTQTFTFVFSDSQDAANLSAAGMLFASSLSYPNSCFVIYDRRRGTVQLESDDVTGASEQPVGSPIHLKNSQCEVGATSVTSSGLTNTITLDIAFKSAFNGLKNIYMYGANADGTVNTGWVQKGVYVVSTVGAPVPSADSVSPSSGGGPAQTFTFVFSDSQDAANLSAAAMLFAPSLAYPDSCFVIYDRNRGTIQLEWDDVAGADKKQVGSPILLENSQCIIGATTVTTSELSTIITVDVTFKSAFSGLKNIYMYGADTDGTINTGWVQRGTWTPF